MSNDQTNKFQSLTGGDLLRHLYRNAIRIAIVTFIVAVVAIGVSLMLPNEFRSSANLMPANTPAIGLDLLTKGSGLGGLAGNLLRTRSSEFDRFLVLLQTHTVKKRVVDTFNLMEVYDTAENQFPLLDAMKRLDANTNFETYDEGNMVIDVWDEDPVRAKEMADFYVQLINEYNIELSTKEASQFREFIGQKYEETLATVDSLQSRTMEFQREFGVIELNTQAGEYISALSAMTAQLYEAELKLKLISENAQESNPLYQRQAQQVSAIRSTLSQMYNNTNPNDVILNYADLPEISTTYVRLMAEAEIQQEMLKFIIPIYENARMEEAKSIPGLVVVDEPYVAERKDRPKRSLIVIGAFMSALLLMIVYYILRLIIHRNRDYIAYIRS
jgi:capsule polysaccharide export protein KpsE/RkpR